MAVANPMQQARSSRRCAPSCSASSSPTPRTARAAKGALPPPGAKGALPPPGQRPAPGNAVRGGGKLPPGVVMFGGKSK